MKKIILTSTLIMAMILSFAGEKDYIQKMQKNLKELNAVESAEGFLKIAERFEQIAKSEQNKWLPNYYVTYAYLNYVFSAEENVNFDIILDKAQAYLNKARDLSPANSEIEVIQGWLYQGRIQADPAVRGMEYSQKAAASFGKAKNLDAGNPRIYFLNGMNVLYTPEPFGGGRKAACPYFIEAKAKFDSFKPDSPIAPNWGKEYNSKQAEDCNN